MENEKEETTETYIPKLTEMVDRLEKANKEAKEILARNEELVARNLLGGKTEAGIQPQKPVEESAKDYTKRIMSGRI